MKIPLQAVGGTVSAAGNNAIVTPAAGKKVRVHYFAYNPETAGTFFYRFGTGGASHLRAKVPAESYISRAFEASYRLDGAVDESLFLNLDAAVNVNYSVYYTEV